MSKLTLEGAETVDACQICAKGQTATALQDKEAQGQHNKAQERYI